MVDQSTKYEDMRQYISSFITGEAAEALINSLADEVQRGEDLAVAVSDQLTICTASGSYIDRKLGALGIARPADLGMDDLSYRNMGIQINATKETTAVLHSVLAVFYGEDAVRAWTQSGQPGPYYLQPGMDLQLEFEDGVARTMAITAASFKDITNATPGEVADVITQFVRAQGLNGSADVFTDPDTNLMYVRIYGAARGPYSTLKILGGQLQSVLEFPQMRGTKLMLNNTVWEITRNVGDTIRFRWTGGSVPALDQVFVGDRVMVYGDNFAVHASETLLGTWTITNVRPASGAVDPTTGWFEIDVPNLSGLAASKANVTPLTNVPGIGLYYTWTVAQGSYDDLKFFYVKKLAPYSQPRYSLAFEPGKRLLKIYLPATARIVHRDLAGGAHLHMEYGAKDLGGSFGSTTDPTVQVNVLNELSIAYPQGGYDNFAIGGTLTYGTTVVPIEAITRSLGQTVVTCSTPHGIPVANPYDDTATYAKGDVVLYNGVDFYESLIDGNLGNDPDTSPLAWIQINGYPKLVPTIVTVVPAQVFVDDQSNPFLGPYMVDPDANYTLTDEVVFSREAIRAGERRSIIFVKGGISAASGQLLFDLGKDTQEGPVSFLANAQASGNNLVGIRSISQSGTTVTVTTLGIHGAIPGSQVAITGTLNFNGNWSVSTVPSQTVYTFVKSPAASLIESIGYSETVIVGSSSTLSLDPSYAFKFAHDVGADINLISSSRAYATNTRGLDYPPYITGTAEGRAYAQSLLEQIVALGIKLEIVIIYPSDVGLGNHGDSEDLATPPVSDAVYVWGTDTLNNS